MAMHWWFILIKQATYSDVTMAAAADMFTEGVKLQVVKRGTMFAGRANHLYQIYDKYANISLRRTQTVKTSTKTD